MSREHAAPADGTRQRMTRQECRLYHADYGRAWWVYDAAARVWHLERGRRFADAATTGEVEG